METLLAIKGNYRVLLLLLLHLLLHTAITH
jgi:hypothetical protein